MERGLDSSTHRRASARRSSTARGDGYREIFLGLNKHFYGHTLKWQSGVQYAHPADGVSDAGRYSGAAFVSGIRIAW